MRTFLGGGVVLNRSNNLFGLPFLPFTFFSPKTVVAGVACVVATLPVVAAFSTGMSTATSAMSLASPVGALLVALILGLGVALEVRLALLGAVPGEMTLLATVVAVAGSHEGQAFAVDTANRLRLGSEGVQTPRQLHGLVERRFRRLQQR